MLHIYIYLYILMHTYTYSHTQTYNIQQAYKILHHTPGLGINTKVYFTGLGRLTGWIHLVKCVCILYDLESRPVSSSSSGPPFGIGWVLLLDISVIVLSSALSDSILCVSFITSSTLRTLCRLSIRGIV